MFNQRRHRSTRDTVPRSGEDGFTLVEVILAILLIATASLIAFPTLLSFFDLSQSARDQNIANHDLRAAAEEILATPFSLVTTTYVDGQPIPKYAERHLDGEQVIVTYPDPGKDPLEVQLRVEWNDNKGRPMHQDARLMRTQ